MYNIMKQFKLNSNEIFVRKVQRLISYLGLCYNFLTDSVSELHGQEVVYLSCICPSPTSDLLLTASLIYRYVITVHERKNNVLFLILHTE
jgi:hypothetical protein